MDDLNMNTQLNATGPRVKSLLGTLDEADLYAGDDNPDIDSRYARGDVLDSGAALKADDRDRNLLRILSAEMNSDRYRIRTPEQQSEWSKKKTQNVRQMAKYMLRFRSVVQDLWQECLNDNLKQAKIFGRMTVQADGQIKLVYDEKLYPEVARLLQNHLNGCCELGIEALSELIAVEYNLSYAQFVRDRAHALMKEFDAAKRDYEKFLQTQPDGKTMSLLALSEDESVSSVRAMEDKTGLDWPLICTVMRNIRLLHLSSEQLKERLVCTNLRGCLFVAMNHYHQVGGTRNVNFDEKDLISEAAMGLMHAADMYVHGTSARFTTYAEYWVRLKVTRYTKDNNSVRVPVHVWDQANTIVREFRRLETSQRMSGAGAATPTREEMEIITGKAISDSVWEYACNRYRGAGLAISCATTSDVEEGEMDFDSIMEPHEGEEESSMASDAQAIMSAAKSNIGTNHENSLTQLQYDILEMSFMQDLKNSEISAKFAENGVSIDSKQIRVELNIALSKIRGFLKLGKVG